MNHPPTRIRHVAARLIACAALALASAAPVLAQTWTAPVQISGATTGSAWTSVGMGADGQAVAAWLQRVPAPASYGVAAATFNPGSGWAAAETVYAPTSAWMLQASPTVMANPDGSASVAWGDSAGAWVANRPAGQTWTPPLNLPATGANAKMAMNRAGDTVVVWADPGYATWVNVWAMRKPAGGVWGSPEVMGVAGTSAINFGWYTSAFVTAVTIADNGDALVVWESLYSSRPCGGKGCGHINTISVARQASSQPGWTSGVYGVVRVIGKPLPYNTFVPALDSQGRAGLFWAVNGGAIMASTQQGPGQAWSPASIAVPTFANVVFPNPYPVRTVAAAASDANGNVTLALTTTQPPTGVANAIEAVSGSLVSNTWAAPVVYARPAEANTLSAPVLAVSAAGRAVMSWAVRRPLSQASVMVVQRADSSAQWSDPVPVAQGMLMPTAAAASVNDQGQAVVLYTELVDTVAGTRVIYGVTR